jgi:hypothetical protein
MKLLQNNKINYLKRQHQYQHNHQQQQHTLTLTSWSGLRCIGPWRYKTCRRAEKKIKLKRFQHFITSLSL